MHRKTFFRGFVVSCNTVNVMLLLLLFYFYFFTLLSLGDVKSTVQLSTDISFSFVTFDDNSNRDAARIFVDAWWFCKACSTWFARPFWQPESTGSFEPVEVFYPNTTLSFRKIQIIQVLLKAFCLRKRGYLSYLRQLRKFRIHTVATIFGIIFWGNVA